MHISVDKNKIFYIFGFAIAAIALNICAGIIDYLDGYEVGLSILYLIPIFVATWHVSRFFGLINAVLSAFVWGYAHLAAGNQYSAMHIPSELFVIRATLFIIFVLILSKLKELLEREKIFARTDFMTGAKNSYFFDEFASLEIERSLRFNRPLTFAYIDCDNFKLINDTCGHSKGDELLRLVTKTIIANIRNIDILARLGGDEFAILFPETDFITSQKAIERIFDELRQTVVRKGFPVTFSFGVATFVKPPKTTDEMVKIGDELMYRAKTSGKNKIIHELINR